MCVCVEIYVENYSKLLTQQSENCSLLMGVAGEDKIGRVTQIFNGIDNGLMYKGYIDVYFYYSL